MNRTYKVIWSKARRCYVVVSELAKSQHKSSSKSEHISLDVHRGYLGKAALAAVVASLLTFSGLVYSPVMAADNTVGSGDGVAIGKGSSAPKAENVAIGKGASISYSGGVGQPSTGDIVIGGGAHINNYIDQGGGIAIGANSFVENMTGGLERSFDFKQAGYKSFWGVPYGLPKDPTKMVTGVAVGQNTYARSGSIMLGTHNYKGNLGDVTVDSVNTKAQNMSLFSTTLGANSYSNGLFSSVTGAYSIASSNYDGGENATKNFGATITGSLNSIESATSSNEYSGVANSIVGVANRTSNSNGSLIFGAGNEIQNSITDISAPTSGGDSAKALQGSLMKAVQKSNSGGATLAIGGGNTANWTRHTQIIGVNNAVAGNESNISDYNLIDGYNNKSTYVTHATVIGSGNTVSGEENGNVEGLILLGDNRNVWSRADHSVVIGSSDDTEHSYVTRPDEVIIGHNAYIENHGGNTSGSGDVAIGHNSFIENYVNQSGSIALGQNSHIRNSTGSTENAFILNQYETQQDATGVTVPTDVVKMNGSIAIGENTFARTGSLMIGTHKYTGEIGDTTVDTYDTTSMAQANQQINETVLGTNSFSLGAFSTVTGAYSIISGDYEKGKWNNFGSSITGSLNSIESKTATAKNAGVASHIIGTANRMQNTNGAVVLGSGNEITDSNIEMSVPTFNNVSAKDLSEKIRTSIQKDSGGAASVVGNGNEVKKSTNVAVMGSKNSVTSTTNSQIFGDNRIVAGADGKAIDGAVIVGSADATAPLTTDKKNVTILGYKANATVEGGVALGAGSVASLDSGKVLNIVGYDPAKGDHSGDTTGTWKSTAAAVSVGDASKNITRQITNVAAGKELTDAVNVAQLKAAQTHFYSVNSTDETAGNYNNDGAKGKNSLAAGVGALAKGDNSVAIGTNAKAQNDALAVGESASAGNNGIAIGMRANAGYGQNMALGYYASVANGVTNSTALGYGSQVTKRDILKSDGNDGVVSVGRSVGQSGEKGMTRRIINVKAGVNDTDAVNVSQLKQRAQAATTEVVAGTNIASVTKNDKTADGHTIYTVNAKGTTVSGDDNFNITSKTDDATNVTDYAISLKNTITIGSGTGTHPITINGTDGVVSGLTNTTWDKNADYSTSTKAATEAQLQKAMKDAQEAAEANDTDTHVKAGTYAVTTVKDAAGKETQGVALDVVDKTGTSVGKVTITDVAKASDVGDVSKLSKEIQNDKGSTTVVDAINNVNTKVNTVDNKVGDLNYSSTHYVKSGDNVTTSISNLDKAIHDATTEAEKHHSTVSEGNNIKVTPTTTDGKTDYKVSLSDDINVNSVTAKAVTATTVTTDNLAVNKSATIGKVTIDGKGTIGGLINKTWDAKNITSGQAATEDQLKAATKNAINYDGDNSNTITLREDTTIKNVADTTIEEGSKNAVNAGTVYKATKNAINYDGDDSKTITLRENTTINNVADTTIEQGSKNAVNAGTVYNETRVAKDGTFVKQANTAGENLSALDNQVTANTESIYHINNRVSDLDNRVNKVGAGAAALAALHPLDFDPDDKWDFAVGYGNYRNANSVAFGAFYRPNEDTMFSLGTNFGNGENMFNAGLSFKIGQGGSGITTSKTAMARKIESLEDTVDKQDKKIAELEALVKEQGEMIRQYVGKK